MRAILTACLLVLVVGVLACGEAPNNDNGGQGEPEILEITEPAGGSTVAAETITIHGRAPANAEVKRDVSFGADDSIRADEAGDWQFEVSLDEGENEFEFFLQHDDDVRVKYKVTYDPSYVATTGTPATDDETDIPEAPTATPPADDETEIPEAPTATPPEDDETGAPEAPTSEPTETEAQAPQFIKGLTAVDVTGNLEDRGFACEGPHKLQTLTEWVCEKTSFSGASSHVSVLGAGSTQIRSIDAFYIDPFSDLSAAVDFLGFLATLPYEDASPQAARSWVQENINGDAEKTTTFGSGRFSLYGPDTGKTLEIVAVGAE